VKISVLVADASSNCLGRGHLLARILARRYEVELVGPAFSAEVWGPLSDSEPPCRTVAIDSSPLGWSQLPRLRKLLTGEVIYACKPLLSSFGMALIEKVRERRPVVLDIDDWDRGITRETLRGLGPRARLRYLLSSTYRPHMVHSCWNLGLFERLSSAADRITVSNRFLQKRFGGALVWHGRDARAYRPGEADSERLRSQHRLAPSARVVMYLGPPRPHKGVEDLVDAVARLSRDDLLLALVGVGNAAYDRQLVARARERLGERLAVFGIQPFERVPEFLAMADVVVVPQRKSEATSGQMPAKLFDAMAMARPIVATDVCDIAAVLDGHGWVVQPGSVEQIANAIGRALDDPREAVERGVRARDRFERHYSWDAMEATLAGVFSPFESA